MSYHMPRLTNELQPGRKLDGLVAELVFRLKREPGEYIDHFLDDNGLPYLCKSYSTDISAAWEVIDKMKELGVLINISYGGNNWNVNFSTKEQYNKLVYDSATSKTIELAICLAGLKSCQSQFR